MAVRTLMTAEDLAKLPDDGSRYELVRGELVRTTRVRYFGSGDIATGDPVLPDLELPVAALFPASQA